MAGLVVWPVRWWNTLVNADGLDKLPLLVISLSQQPRYFASNRINIDLLNIMWRHNKKAWITTVIILNWLT